MATKIFYHAHVAGFMKQADTIAEVQVWLDALRSRVVGEFLTVTRVVNCLADKAPILSGSVSA